MFIVICDKIQIDLNKTNHQSGAPTIQLPTTETGILDFSDSVDLKVMLWAIEQVRKIVAAEPLMQSITRETQPGTDKALESEDLKDWVRFVHYDFMSYLISGHR